MRKLFAIMTTGLMLLAASVAASAKTDDGTSGQSSCSPAAQCLHEDSTTSQDKGARDDNQTGAAGENSTIDKGARDDNQAGATGENSTIDKGARDDNQTGAAGENSTSDKGARDDGQLGQVGFQGEQQDNHAD